MAAAVADSESDLSQGISEKDHSERDEELEEVVFEEETDQNNPVWLLPWEKIMCYLPLSDVATLKRTNSHFRRLGNGLRFWQLYFYGLAAPSGYRIKRLRFPHDMKLERIAEYWRRLVRSESLHQQAIALQQQGKYEEALPFFDRALSVKVLRSDKLTLQVAATILQHRAQTALQLHRYFEAALNANRAIILKANLHKAHLIKGKALGNLWFHKAAKKALSSANSLEPQSGCLKLITKCDKIIKANTPSNPLLFSRKPLAPLTAAPSDGRLVLLSPGSWTPAPTTGAVGVLCKSFSGEDSAVCPWSLFEVLQVRRLLDGPDGAHKGFVLEPLSIAQELDILNQRLSFLSVDSFFGGLWECSVKRARKVYKDIRKKLKVLGSDSPLQADTLVHIFWRHLANVLRVATDEGQWKNDLTIPLESEKEAKPLELEILAEGYPLDEPPPSLADREPTLLSKVSLDITGPLHLSWVREYDSDDDDSDDDDDDSDDPSDVSLVEAAGKTIIELESDNDFPKALARGLAKSLMALRDSDGGGVHFPRHIIVSSGLQWWFVKLGSRLHLYGACIQIDPAECSADPESLTASTPVITKIQQLMQLMYIIMRMTIEDLKVDHDSSQKELTESWLSM